MNPIQGETTAHIYETCDADYLRRLRESSGMDEQVLAKRACLSVAQVRALEKGAGDSVFYTDAIKRQAYKRLLMILGAEPPTTELMDIPLPARQEHQAQLHNLDQIAAMSRLPSIVQSPWAPLQALAHRALEHKQVLGAATFLALSAALLVGNWPQGGTAEVVSSVAEAASSATAAASESVAAVGGVLSKPVASEPTAVASSAPIASVAASAPVVVASAPAKPASAPAVVVINAATTCAFTSEALPQVSPMVANKPGRYVHFVSGTDVALCVVDGSKQVTTLTLKAGESRSVYGVSPWQVSSTGLNKVQIFFQGWRVSLPSEATQRMTLVEKSITP
jgi:DNA-binding transcriptional regulator YiaG